MIAPRNALPKLLLVKHGPIGKRRGDESLPQVFENVLRCAYESGFGLETPLSSAARPLVVGLDDPIHSHLLPRIEGWQTL